MGAVTKDMVVATLTSVPISHLKNKKMIIVLRERSINQKLYSPSFLKPSRLSVIPVDRGEASKHVSVVLNIVIKEAMAININIFFPRLEVNSLMSWPANSVAFPENLSPEWCITIAPSAIKHRPRKTVVR